MFISNYKYNSIHPPHHHTFKIQNKTHTSSPFKKNVQQVDIKGIDKVEILKHLWDNSKPASFYNKYCPIAPPRFDYEESMEAVKMPIDYFRGRLIKCDLSKDSVDPSRYDQDFGTGKFQQIINQIKQQIP